ncbi:MAG: CopG family transcriptional regulator [Candidatus Latescibacterota bacterium]
MASQGVDTVIRTIVQLTEGQAEGLRRRAREEGVSVSELVRRGVDRVLATPTGHEEMRRRAIAALGFVRHEPDLPEDHDRYLGKAYAASSPWIPRPQPNPQFRERTPGPSP